MPISPKQAVCRMNTGHARELAALAAQTTLDTTGWNEGCYRGARKVHSTLCHWGAVANGQITAQGLEILAAYRAKYPLHRI